MIPAQVVKRKYKPKVHMGTYIPYTGWYASCRPGANYKATLVTRTKADVTCQWCLRLWLNKNREWAI